MAVRVTLLLTWLLVLLGYLIVSGDGVSPEESFNVHTQLLNSLNEEKVTKYSLRKLFFPVLGIGPVCTPIRYEIYCSNETENNTPVEYSFLWTSYDSSHFVGKLFLSSALYGLSLAGFGWGESCVTFNQSTVTPLVIRLQLSLDCDMNNTILRDELLAFTSALKAYASQNDLSYISGPTLSTYRAYAVEWDERTDSYAYVHETLIVLAILVTVLDLFIFFLSLGTSEVVYDAIFEGIKHRGDRYYSLFWGLVVFSLFWNVYPGWAVLTVKVGGLEYGLIAIVLMQLITAVIMRKYQYFKIPLLRIHPKHTLPTTAPINDDSQGTKPQTPKYFFWEICRLEPPAQAFVSLSIQTIAIWSLLVSFTFVVYYAVIIAVDLYVNPIPTLVKLLFIKAVALSAVVGIGLLFSNSPLRKLNRKEAWIKNVLAICQFLSALTFLPILAYLTYIIGGVIFNSSSSELSGFQGILAVLPSASLVVVGWMSRGKLFPEVLIPPIAQTKAALKSDGGGSDDDGDDEHKVKTRSGYGSIKHRSSTASGDKGKATAPLMPAKTV